MATQPVKRTVMANQYHAIQYDPAMLQINLLIKNSGMPLNKIARKCGVSAQTMRRWMQQKTHRPQGLTMRFVLRVLGYDFKITPSAGHNKPPEE